MTLSIKKAIIASFAIILISSLAEAAFLPTPEKLTLKNGVTVYFLKNSDLPVVSFRMIVKNAGYACEPAEQEGIADLTAALMLKGTERLDAEAVAEALDFMGARFDISVGREYAFAGGQSLAEHFPRLMEIAADCLEHPSFQEDEFTKEMQGRIDRLKSIKDNPGRAIRFYFQKAYFGSHPMGHLASGTQASLEKINNADVGNFYRSHFRPERTIAAVVGDIDRARLEPLLNSTLGSWQASGAAAPEVTIPAAPKPAGKKLFLIDKPDATQAYWILGAPGFAMGDAVSPQADVMNTLFGGRFTSWLSTELRIKRGLTYGARSGFDQWRGDGLFTASSYTKNDKIGEMLDITFDLLKKARTDGFTAEEVTSARNYIQGQFPPTLESNASKASEYLNLVFYDLGFDYYDRYMARIRNVSPEEVGKAAEVWIPENDFVLVVVGRSADIRAQLQKYGTWTEKKITDPGF